MTGGIHFVLSVVVISVVARKTSHNMMSSGTAVPIVRSATGVGGNGTRGGA